MGIFCGRRCRETGNSRLGSFLTDVSDTAGDVIKTGVSLAINNKELIGAAVGGSQGGAVAGSADLNALDNSFGLGTNEPTGIIEKEIQTVGTPKAEETKKDYTILIVSGIATVIISIVSFLTLKKK